MWLLLFLAESHPFVTLLVAGLMVLTGVLGVIALIIRHRCRIVGSLVVVFQSDEAVARSVRRAQIAGGDDTFPSYSCSVKFTWRRVGQLELDDRGHLIFPPVPDQPGIYKLTITTPADTIDQVYVGEAEQLRR